MRVCMRVCICVCFFFNIYLQHAPLQSNTTCSSFLVMNYNYTSTDPLDHTGPLTGSLYLYFYLLLIISQYIPMTRFVKEEISVQTAVVIFAECFWIQKARWWLMISRNVLPDRLTYGVVCDRTLGNTYI